MAFNLLTDVTLSPPLSTQSVTGSWATITGLSDTKNVASASSVLILIGTMQMEMTSTDECAGYRLTVDGTPVGGQLIKFADAADEGNGCCLVAVATGYSGSTTFAFQWIDAGSGTASRDTGRTETLQVVEITSDASIIVDLNSAASGSLTGSWANVANLSASPTVTAGSLLMFIATVNPVTRADDAGDFRFAIDGARNGPLMSAQTDATGEGDGVCLVWFETGVAGGTRTLSLQGINRLSTFGLNETYLRALQVVEITGSDWALPVDVQLTSAATAGAWGTITGMTGTYTPDSASSIILMGLNMTIAGDSGDAKADFRLAVGGSREGARIVAWTDDTERVTGTTLLRAKTGISASTVWDAHWNEIGGDTVADTGRERTWQVVDLKAGGAPPATAVQDVIGQGVVPFAR
jgi:hypothetical protein